MDALTKGARREEFMRALGEKLEAEEAAFGRCLDERTPDSFFEYFNQQVIQVAAEFFGGKKVRGQQYEELKKERMGLLARRRDCKESWSEVHAEQLRILSK
eukprot:7208622-Lingulodinium_polyedra.AAC.1